MQPRTLDQILSELNPIYQPEVDLYRKQQKLVPGVVNAEVSGLDAKKDNAFNQILGGARQRGLGFSGIPLQEQATYTASDYLPAVARARAQGQDQAMSLEQAIIGTNQRKQEAAMNMRQYEQQRYDQQMAEQRQLAAQRQAAAANNSYLGSLFGGGQNTATASPKMTKKKDGGFAFTDPNGQPVSAAVFSAMTGVPFRQLLADMAKQGDRGAKYALGFVGDDYGYDPNNVLTPNAVNIYKALTWGTNMPDPTVPQPNKIKYNSTAGLKMGASNVVGPNTIGGQQFSLYRK